MRAGKEISMEEKTIDLERAPAFAVLFHLGKMTMRPGGTELTRQMLDGLQIGERDHVVELAPGRGATTRLVLTLSPQSYTAVERDRSAQQKAQKLLRDGELGRCILGKAQATGLDDGCASVVLSELFHLSRRVAACRRLPSNAGIFPKTLRPFGEFSVLICERPRGRPPCK
jgi:hypothetical protein